MELLYASMGAVLTCISPIQLLFKLFLGGSRSEVHPVFGKFWGPNLHYFGRKALIQS
jgi:hypothetical protein